MKTFILILLTSFSLQAQDTLRLKAEKFAPINEWVHLTNFYGYGSKELYNNSYFTTDSDSTLNVELNKLITEFEIDPADTYQKRIHGYNALMYATHDESELNIEIYIYTNIFGRKTLMLRFF